MGKNLGNNRVGHSDPSHCALIHFFSSVLIVCVFEGTQLLQTSGDMMTKKSHVCLLWCIKDAMDTELMQYV